MIKAIIFDLGDTLVLNSHTKDKINKPRLTYTLFDKEGMKISWDDFLKAEQKAKDIYDYDYDGKVERFEPGFFYEKIGITLGFDKPREVYSRIDKSIQAEFMKHMQLPENIYETLNTLLDKKIQLAVISNGHRNNVIGKLEHSKLIKYFKHIFISYELGEDKSSLTAFRAMVKKLGVLPQECMMVGDRQDEDMYARKVGIWTVLVKYVPKKATAKEVMKPHFELLKFDQLPKIMKQINEGGVKFE